MQLEKQGREQANENQLEKSCRESLGFVGQVGIGKFGEKISLGMKVFGYGKKQDRVQNCQ